MCIRPVRVRDPERHIGALRGYVTVEHETQAVGREVRTAVHGGTGDERRGRTGVRVDGDDVTVDRADGERAVGGQAERRRDSPLCADVDE